MGKARVALVRWGRNKDEASSGLQEPSRPRPWFFRHLSHKVIIVSSSTSRLDCDSLGKGPFPTGLFYGFLTHLVKRFFPYPHRKSQIKNGKCLHSPWAAHVLVCWERVGSPQTRQLVSLYEKGRTLSLFHLCQFHSPRPNRNLSKIS